MKIKLLISFLLVLFSAVLTPTNAYAQTCSSLNGRCVPLRCSQGAPISSTDCNFPGFNCCPNEPDGNTCSELGGRCVLSGTCANGAPISSSDCTVVGFKCCPTEVGNPHQALGLKCTNDDGEWGVNTAIGCISTDIKSGGFVTSLLKLAVGLGGGIALLLILYGIFIVTTSAGIPDKLKEGKEVITSALAGLIFIILSIFLMNLIGVKILSIPGL
ncbi:hypothetical protein HY333_01620 [Candidatus Collierbacteria bacterium]|nr:hypothetical protein [Candidatus Collierbacteria bacterium]